MSRLVVYGREGELRLHPIALQPLLLLLEVGYGQRGQRLALRRLSRREPHLQRADALSVVPIMLARILDLPQRVRARNPFRTRPFRVAQELVQQSPCDLEELSTLVADIEFDRKGVPILLKQ